MDYIIQFCFSFLATASLCVIFNAPIRTIPYCGLVGAVGWIIYYIIIQLEMSVTAASFMGAFVVAILAQFFARILKMPMIVFIVSGIIPLVPGGLAYNTMRNLVVQNFSLGMETGIHVLLISGAIAMGIVFAEVFVQMFVRILKRGRTSMQSFERIKRQQKYMRK